MREVGGDTEGSLVGGKSEMVEEGKGREGRGTLDGH